MIMLGVMPFRRKIISIGIMSSRAPETCCGVEWSPLLFNAHEAPVIFGPDDWMHCYMLMPPKCLCSHHLQLGATHRSGEQHSSASIPARNTNNPQTEVEILHRLPFCTCRKLQDKECLSQHWRQQYACMRWIAHLWGYWETLSSHRQSDRAFIILRSLYIAHLWGIGRLQVLTGSLIGLLSYCDHCSMLTCGVSEDFKCSQAGW